MLEKIDLSKTMDKKEYKKRMEVLGPKLARLQRELKSCNIPVMIVFEGFGGAGKGTQINHLIEPMDPRGFTVYSTQAETQEEQYHPFLWRFWNKTPEKGRIAIFDRSWYGKLLVERYEKKTHKKDIPGVLEDIENFEKQLTDDGTLLIKFFLAFQKRSRENALINYCQRKRPVGESAKQTKTEISIMKNMPVWQMRCLQGQIQSMHRGRLSKPMMRDMRQ